MTTDVPNPSAVNGLQTIVVLTLDEPRYALSAGVVELVIPALEIVPLPGAPDTVLGVIDLHGATLPVMDIRARLRRPRKPPSIDDHFVVVRTARRRLVLPVDRVADVRRIDAGNRVDTRESLPYEGTLAGIVKLDDELILIHDVDAFLSLDEERLIDEAMHEK